jgi:hypothetical protein
MKTVELNIEIADKLKREIKSRAAMDGVSLKVWAAAALMVAARSKPTTNSSHPNTGKHPLSKAVEKSALAGAVHSVKKDAANREADAPKA